MNKKKTLQQIFTWTISGGWEVGGRREGGGTIDCVPKWAWLQVAVMSRAVASVF